MNTSQLSIRFKVSVLNAAIIFGIIFLGVIGYLSIERLLKLQELNTTVDLIHVHMDADMMHDAIRQDASELITAVSKGDRDRIGELQKKLAEKIKRLGDNFEQAYAIQANHQIETLQEIAKPIVDNYLKAANLILMNSQLKEDQNPQVLGELYAKEFVPAFDAFEKSFAEIGVAISEWSKSVSRQATEDALFGKISIGIAFLVSMLLGLFGPVFLRWKFFLPLNRLLDVAKNLMQGNLTEIPPYMDRCDEIGNISHALDALRLQMKESVQLKQMIDELPINIMIADPQNDLKVIYLNKASKEMLRRLQGYISVSPDNVLGNTLDGCYENPEEMRQILSDPRNLPYNSRLHLGPETVDLRVSAVIDEHKNYMGALLYWNIVTQSEKLAQDFEHSIGSVSTEITASAGTLEQRAVALQGAIEELSAAAREISARIHDSLSIVQTAVTKGDHARDNMSQLSTAAERVSSVVTLIRSIAEKTNLLALNATIESARAGEAGKGFAVVANEVKTLANQTATAITDINSQISDMQTYAEASFSTVKEMCETIVSVNNIATDIASAVEEQQASTSEIVRSIGRVNGDGADSATSIMSMALQLKSASAVLSNDCDTFLKKVNSI